MEYVDRLSLRTAEIEHDRLQWDIEYRGLRFTVSHEVLTHFATVGDR